MPDAVRARAFYGAVLGWRFVPGERPGHWYSISDGGPARPAAAVAGGHADAVVVPTFRIGDAGAAVAAVRAGGGTATDPAPDGSGVTAACTDDQGAAFALRGY